MDGEIFYGAAYTGQDPDGQGNARPSNDCGSGTTTDDFMEKAFDLNEQFIRNKTSTFFFRMNGDSMQNAGIYSGDTLIVDRSAKATSGKIVIAVLNGELLVRRLEKTFNKIRLVPETNRLSPMDIDPSGAEFSIWGVVTYNIHGL